jgi:hypothetical protein
MASTIVAHRSHHRRPYLRIVDPGVPLGRGDRLVPEQHLHGAQVAGAAVGARGEAGRHGTFCAGADLKATQGGRSARGRSRIADRRGEFAWSVEHDKCGAFGNFDQSCVRKGIEKSPGVIEGEQPVGGTPHECDGFIECLDGRGRT